MRRQPTTNSTHVLHTLIAVLPDEALRPLLLELLRNGAGTDLPAAPVQDDPASAPRRPRRRGGWPKGEKRGRPRKGARADADTKRLERNERAKLWARKTRAAAKAALQADSHQAGNGASTASTGITPAQLWEHAARVSPKTPWKAVAREFGTNEAQALDCWRTGSLIPGIAAEAIRSSWNCRRRDMVCSSRRCSPARRAGRLTTRPTASGGAGTLPRVGPRVWCGSHQNTGVNHAVDKGPGLRSIGCRSSCP
jgi:hypothetical protein